MTYTSCKGCYCLSILKLDCKYQQLGTLEIIKMTRKNGHKIISD